MIIPSLRNFKRVRQSGSDDCVPACVATVLSMLTSGGVSAESVKAKLRMKRDGSFLTEAGIFLQQLGFRTHFELWKWQKVFPRSVFPSHARPRLKKKLLEVSSAGGIYRDERFVTYLNSGGKITLGGNAGKMVVRLKMGAIAILGLDGGNLRAIDREIRHAVVAFVPQDHHTAKQLYIYCPTVGDVVPHSPSDVERAILSDQRGAALYIL